MNAARILIKKTNGQESKITVLEGDFINTKNLTSLEPSLLEIQKVDCKLEVLSINDQKLVLKSLGLTDENGSSDFDFELMLNDKKILIDEIDQVNFEISLIGLKIGEEFFGLSF